MKSWWWFSGFLLLISAAWIILSAPDPSTADEWQASAPAIGFVAPDFVLTNSLGEEIQLSELRGAPVVINFWASWCAPCRAEMPAIQEIADRYQDQGLTVLGINATAGDSFTKAVDFIAINRLKFPILFDYDNTVNSAYQVRSLPTTFFVDAEGMIDDIVIGGPMSEALLQTRIEKLIEVGR